MAHLSGTARERFVQGIFSHIAPQYDLMNRLMTFGKDRSWRRKVIKRAGLQGVTKMVLDVGGGTGDLGFEAIKSHPEVIAVETDFTLEMMLVGKEKQGSDLLRWSAADAASLPYPDHTFEAVISGFLLRNVADLSRVLSEQFRVLVPGGRIVTLDTTPPPANFLKPLVNFYLYKVIPFLGRKISGQTDAYVYLPSSTERFIPAEELAAHMAAVGFVRICFERFNFGTIAIHWGEKGN